MRRLAIKIQLCFILVLMQITRSYAQVNTGDYHPFVVEGKMWNCSWCEWDKNNINPTIHSYSYLIQGDTIIDNTEWKRVYVRDKATFDDESWHYCLAVREQNKRVYKIDQGNKDATLLYDFDLPINSIIDYGEQKVALSPDYTINTHIKLKWGRKSGIVSYEGNNLNRYGAAVLLVYEGEDSEESLPGFCVVEGVGARSDPFMPQFWICNWGEGTSYARGESEFVSCYENGVCITTDDAIEGSFETGWSVFTTEEGVNLYCQALPPGVVMICGLNIEEGIILENLTIPGMISKYPNYPTVVREYFLDNVKIRNVILKEGVSGVQPYAFRNCSYLETLTIPSTINDYSGLESNAFAQCDNIKLIYSDWSAPTAIPDDVFSEQVYNNAILYVPVGSLAIYQSTPGWNQFKNIEEFDATGIKDIRTSYNTSSQIFDLTGRRLNSIPQKGMYIQGRKKWFVK